VPTVVDAAVAGTAPNSWLSGRNTIVYAANASVPASTRPVPASAR